MARLAALDSISVHATSRSSFIRSALKERGYSLPKHPTGVMELVKKYFQEVVDKNKKQLQDLKNEGCKFSCTLDECTSLRNRKYLNLNVHHPPDDWNLGLVRIQGSCPAEKFLEAVEKKLQEFGLSCELDIVASSSDGASVMVRFGKRAPFELRLCYVHAVHLGIVDVLYKKETCSTEKDMEAEDEEISESSEEEESRDNEDPEGEEVSEVEEEGITHELKEDLHHIIRQVTKIVKKFKKSPKKNDLLQEYVRQEHGKELTLLLDCKTR